MTCHEVRAPIYCNNSDILPTSVVPEQYGPCSLRVVHPAGTIDVENVKNGRWYRITGLNFSIHEKKG